MATKKQQQELINVLKFTPIKVRMLIQGYGGESYAGRVERKIYDYFASQRIDMDEYAGDWDGVFSDNVPRELQPFQPGSPYECDGLWHASGAEMTDLNEIRVDADDGKEIWVHNCGYSDLEDSGVTVNQYGGEDLDDLDEGEVVFWGGQGEKGCFFDAEFTLKAPFDPKKLTIGYENCDGWYIINSVEYDGEELDGSGGYSTTGKWAEHKWIVGGDEEVYDSVALDDREDEGLEWSNSEWDPAAELEKIEVPVLEGEEEWAQRVIDESQLSAWFPGNVKPVRKGTYEVEYELTTWPWPISCKIEWSGRSWKHQENRQHITIKQWRGLNHPCDE